MSESPIGTETKTYSESESDSGEWTTVTYKKPAREKKQELKLDQKDVIKKLYDYFTSHQVQPHGVYLYGSTSRNQHTKTSDIDVFVLYSQKTEPCNILMNEMKKELYKIFSRKVDLVCYSWTNGQISVLESCMYFVTCVQADAIIVYENIKDSKYLTSAYLNYYSY
jgi:predicted nucleotidyltransferase